MNALSVFLKTKRKQLDLTQEEFAEKAGVALTVIRKIEQGKENLSLSKVNQVLHMFGHVLGPIKENDATRIS
jgi:y4mF family transcriptional regulator